MSHHWIEDELFPRVFYLTKPLKRRSRYLSLNDTDHRHVQAGDYMRFLGSGEGVVILRKCKNGSHEVKRSVGSSRSASLPTGTSAYIIASGVVPKGMTLVYKELTA